MSPAGRPAPSGTDQLSGTLVQRVVCWVACGRGASLLERFVPLWVGFAVGLLVSWVVFQPRHIPADTASFTQIIWDVDCEFTWPSDRPGAFVDGVAVAPPATFHWPLRRDGSCHAEDSLDLMRAVRWAYGRWGVS